MNHFWTKSHKLCSKYKESCLYYLV